MGDSMSDGKENKPVLVVDDEETLRFIISSVLEDEGYQVTTAASGEEAMRLLEANPYKLVISDIVMPGMSGIDLLRKIKEKKPETEVVIITSQASLETAVTAVGAGAYDYLIKPFDQLEVITSVAHKAFEKIRLTEEKERLVNELHGKNIELKQTVNSLEEMANRDGLTGLYNHRYFKDALTMEVDRSKRYDWIFSLLFIDIDYFKNYNDTNGHPAGDEVLRSLTAIVHKFLRKTDVFARYGGEEFTVILPETPKDFAAVVAGSMREIVEKHQFFAEESQPDGKLTISIGVATYPEDAETGEDLIERADQAMYKAKQTGRNRVCISGRDV